MPEVDKHCMETINKVMFANKQDKTIKSSKVASPGLKKSKSLTGNEEMDEFINSNGFNLYKTSAMNNTGIQDGFMHIAREEALNYDEDDELER